MKFIYHILLFLLPFNFYAQVDMFIISELEGGVLQTDYQLNDNITNNIIDGENAHYNIKGAIAFVAQWERISTTAGLSQSLRFWELKGDTNNTLKVKNIQSFPSLFVGGYYQFPINRIERLNIYGGTRLGIDFMNFDSLNERSGVVMDYVEGITDDTESVAFNMIPEIGLKGYFNSGNFWQLSARYNLPLNGDIIQGTIRHYRNQIPIETIRYQASGQFFCIGLTYGFLLNK